MSGHIAGRVLAIAAAAALAGCAGPPAPPAGAAAGGPIGATELRALYATAHREDGVVLHGAHAGARWTKWARPDGSLELSAAHGLFADTGRYVLKGDQICSSWSQIDDGRQICMRLRRTGPDTYVSVEANGNEGSRFKVGPP